MNSAIQTLDLTRRFGRVDAIEGLNLDVPAGSVCALIGPNGAGKTTTIKVLLNLLRPSKGKAIVLGTDSRRLDSADLSRIGYVSEDQRLPGWMTPADFLDYVRPLYPRWDEALCRKLCDVLGLSVDRPLKTLSRGTRMKAALLASLAYRPDLIILDEPFAGLDALVRDDLIRALLELAGQYPWTALISSHDIDEVERLADSVALLDRGRLILAEAVSSLLSRFRKVEVIESGDGLPKTRDEAGWLAQNAAGHTLRFVDTRHDRDDAFARIGAAYPGADIRVEPMSLREIFMTMARHEA
jgi:ABC-2 type transport system ATP-binding protein